jgi:hypothetical protein
VISYIAGLSKPVPDETARTDVAAFVAALRAMDI